MLLMDNEGGDINRPHLFKAESFDY